MEKTIQLRTDSVLQIPFQKYQPNFTFIVNSKKYETNIFIADLLSPKISSHHLIDPTLDEFIINTKSTGDFNKIINLVNFEKHEIDDNDSSFILEVFDQLGAENVNISLINSNEEITNDNIFDFIKEHQKHPVFCAKQLENEINYFSSHFSELKEKLLKSINEERFEIKEEIIELIICNKHLQLDTENDLLEIINSLYLNDTKFSYLYEYVDFINVEIESIKKFTKIFNINDMTNSTWSSIINRLEQPIINDKKCQRNKHTYRNIKHDQIFIEIKNEENKFDGIVNYLRTHSKINDEIKITSSSGSYGLSNIIKYDKTNTNFYTEDEKNSWICFDFKNYSIIPSDYIIRSFTQDVNWHLKNWVLEGSNDQNKWTNLDEQKNNSFLNGSNFVHSFPISMKSEEQQSFKYIRIRQTGPNWCNNDRILINSIEFYGKLIYNK